MKNLWRRKEMKLWKRMIQDICEEDAYHEDEEQQAMIFVHSLVLRLLERNADLEMFLRKRGEGS